MHHHTYLLIVGYSSANFQNKLLLSVFTEGEQGEEFYVIVKGSVVISSKARRESNIQVLNTLKEGQGFGELALVSDGPRYLDGVDSWIKTERTANQSMLILARLLPNAKKTAHCW